MDPLMKIAPYLTREEHEVSSENDEKNSAEVTCPRCDGCGQLANSDEREPWSVWMALPVGSALAVTMGLVKPEPCDECGGTGKAAGERRTGTLNLAGQGNPALSPISNEAADAAARVFYGGAYGSVGDEANRLLLDGAREALEAAYPAIRQQVAEEIAPVLAEFLGKPAGDMAAEITRRIGRGESL